MTIIRMEKSVGMSNRRSSRSLAAAVAVAVVVAAAGCGSEDDGGVPEDQVVVPATAPAGWQESRLDGVTLATPRGWTESSTHDDEYDATMHNLQTEENEFGTRGGVQVMVVRSPERSAQEAVEAIETGMAATVGLTDSAIEEVQWPGAQQAWYLTFVADVPNSAGDRAPHRADHLVLDLSDGSQVQATVTALSEDFEELGMNEVLASIALD